MDIVDVLFFILLCTALLFNIIAITALVRSKRLSYNIRIFSINLAVSDVGTIIACLIVTRSGDNLDAYDMNENCLQKILVNYTVMWSYFTSSFLVTAMGIERFVSVVYPYKYLDIMSSRRRLITHICIALWVTSLVVVIFHDIENNGRLYLCASQRYVTSAMKFGFQHSSLRVVGSSNLLIFVTNVATYTGILTHIWRKTSEVTRTQYSTLLKLLAFAVAYAVLHGPFNLTSVVVGIFDLRNMIPSSAIQTVMTFTLLAIIVDPILYAWRYTDCRMQMLKILCYCNRSFVRKLQRKQNDFYSSYVINVSKGRKSDNESWTCKQCKRKRREIMSEYQASMGLIELWSNRINDSTVVNTAQKYG